MIWRGLEHLNHMIWRAGTILLAKYSVYITGETRKMRIWY
ncbi:unnamed protein product, partial [Staurois parvus]